MKQITNENNTIKQQQLKLRQEEEQLYQRKHQLQKQQEIHEIACHHDIMLRDDILMSVHGSKYENEFVYENDDIAHLNIERTQLLDESLQNINKKIKANEKQQMILQVEYHKALLKAKEKHSEEK